MAELPPVCHRPAGGGTAPTRQCHSEGRGVAGSRGPPTPPSPAPLHPTLGSCPGVLAGDGWAGRLARSPPCSRALPPPPHLESCSSQHPRQLPQTPLISATNSVSGASASNHVPSDSPPWKSRLQTAPALTESEQRWDGVAGKWGAKRAQGCGDPQKARRDCTASSLGPSWSCACIPRASTALVPGHLAASFGNWGVTHPAPDLPFHHCPGQRDTSDSCVNITLKALSG